jgi:hypothetical protein
METGDKTVECLEIAAVKEGNCTLAANDIDWSVSQIHCLSVCHVVNLYLVIQNCGHPVVGSQIGLHVEPYSLSSVKILSSTCSVKPR